MAAAALPAEAVDLDLGGVRVRLWRAAQLERFVDGAALLTDDDPAEPPYWMHLWPGALAAARRVATAAEVCAGARVLELGCGLGLPALVAARRGARVVATDWKRDPLAFVRRSAAASGCRVALAQMDWAAAALRGGFDVCVGADVGYDRAAEPALVAVLERLLAARGVAWLIDSVNTARTSLATALATAGFVVRHDQTREWEEGRPVWVRSLEVRRQ